MGYRALSKSTLQLGLQCQRAFWIKAMFPGENDDNMSADLAASPLNDAVNIDDANEIGSQMSPFDIGNLVGHAAIAYFNDDKKGYAVEIIKDRGFDSDAYASYAAETASYMADPECHTIAEAAFFLNGTVIVFADVLHRNDDGGWDMYEVKAPAYAKPHHAQDVAWQVYVARACGADITRAFIMTPQRSWKDFDCSPFNDKDWRELPSTKDMFQVVSDYTGWIDKSAGSDMIPDTIDALLGVLDLPEPPHIADDVHRIGKAVRCLSPYVCPYQGKCHQLYEQGWA